MLSVFFYAIIVAVISTVIIAGGGRIAGQGGRRTGAYYDDIQISQIIAILMVQFVEIAAGWYIFCIEQTPLGLMRWLWSTLIIPGIIILFSDLEIEYITSVVVLGVISLVFWASGFFAPQQNLVYIHDMENVDIAYTISSDEILAKMELKVDNSIYLREKYEIDTPEMRKVAGKDVAVYQIHDKTGVNGTEYIPGYAIKVADKLPEFVSKRMYFDTSYVYGRDALRRIRKEYPTLIIGSHKFDIDDDWNPYEIYEYREKFYTSNGEDDYGIITIDLRDGTCQRYKANEVPDWVDFKTTEPK